MNCQNTLCAKKLFKYYYRVGSMTLCRSCAESLQADNEENKVLITKPEREAQ